MWRGGEDGEAHRVTINCPTAHYAAVRLCRFQMFSSNEDHPYNPQFLIIWFKTAGGQCACDGQGGGEREQGSGHQRLVHRPGALLLLQ